MRFLVLIALCLAVASASYSNRNRFNRLLRALQQQQEQGRGYGNQGYSYNDQYDLEDQDEDEQDNLYRQQRGQRNQRYGQLNNLDDDENGYDSDEQDDEQDQYQNQYQGQNQRQNQRQNRHQRQQRRQQQQQHQCQPKYHLLQALEQPNSQLAAKLYKQAKQENDDKNTVISPAAVQIALAAIQQGARGNTKRQIQRITGGGLNQQQNKQAHTALQQSLKGQDQEQQQGQNQQAKIKTTTTIIINQRNRAQQRFIRAVQACLNAQVKKCNFQHQAQQCRQQINRYVAQKTNHKLQHAVPQDAVTENTKLVVVNTAQVKAKWGRQFRQQQQTKQGRFYPLGSQQPKHVQVLQSQGQFNYYEDEQLQIVGVPTQQQELTLYVIVPKNKDGLNQVEKTQIENGQQLKELLENAEQNQEEVEIELPKIQIKHKLDAKQTLRKEGVQDAFDADEADLSGINGQQGQQGQNRRRRQQQNQYNDDEDQDQYEQDQDEQQQQRGQQLHVNKLIHQATIKIDERGIRAANPRHQGQQGQQGQYEQDEDQYENQQDQDQDQDEDEEDEQERQYRQQQEDQQELYEEIFGQYQQGHHRQQRRNRRHNRNNRNQYQGQQGEKRVKANRAFAFALKHNPSNQIVLVGRVVDAAQKPKNQQQNRQQGQQSLNGVDQQ